MCWNEVGQYALTVCCVAALKISGAEQTVGDAVAWKRTTWMTLHVDGSHSIDTPDPVM